MMKKTRFLFCAAGLSLLAGGCSLEQPCKEQALKCETDSTTQYGIRYTCIDGAWLNPEEGYSCKDGETWGECNNGAKKCDEGGIKTCENGMWSAPDDSCMGRGCLNSNECAACADGEILCNPETGAYKMCWSGGWFPYDTPCESGKCSEDGKSCAEKLDCTEGQVECFESILKTCSDGHWVTGSCPDNGACRLDNTGCSECVAGDTQCKDGVLKICVNEAWVESRTCACRDDKSCAECTSGQSQCDSLKSYRECTDDKEWGASQACASNQNCVIAVDGKALCTDEPVSCMDGVKQCIGDKLYVCNSNAWNEEQDCKYGCNAETGACNECQNGDTSCFEGVLKTCVNHVWSNPTNCKGIVCVDEYTCANCVVGESCDNNNQSVGTVTECYDGITQTQANCDGVSCNSDKTMCGVCKNGAQKCENLDDKIGIPSICMNGNWEGGNVCAGDVSCKGNVCGQCRNNTKKCENNKEYICSEGAWVVGESCVNGCNAGSTACVPSDVCTNGEEKCVEGMKYTCHANVWSSETACTGGVSCRNETTCGECRNNDTLCIDGKSSVCQNGVWGEGVVCPDHADCQNGKKCGVCSGNSEKCQDGKKYACSEGLWGTGVTCSKGASCKDATSCGECANGANRCINDSSGVGQFSTCLTGGWSKNMACFGSVSCFSDTVCGVCKNGSTKCESDRQYICENGDWIVDAPCVNGCGISGIACAPSDVCTNGSVKCESGVKYTCANNSWGLGLACNASCKNATECGECTDNDKKCENNKAYTCSGGLWGNGNPCPNGCSSLTRQCAGCSPNSTQCANSGSVGKIKTCTNGEWPLTGQNCTNNFSCKSSTDCGECSNNAKKCVNNVAYDCRNGLWEKEQDCSLGCNSSTQQCVQCEPLLMVTADSGVNSTITCVTGDVLFAEDATIFDYRALISIDGNVGTGDTVSLKTINLPKLETVKEEINIIAPGLYQFNIPAIKSLGGLRLKESQIPSLIYYNNLTIEGEFVINNNNKLTSIDLYVDKLGDKNGTMQIHENAALENILFKKATVCPSEIYIADNEVLKNIYLNCSGVIDSVEIAHNGKLDTIAMPNINKITVLNITENAMLSKIDLSSIEEIEYLNISGDTSLDCDGVCLLAKKSSNVVVSGDSDLKDCDCL